MTLAEELARAADKLDALAAEATDGPWTGRIFDDACHQYADVIGKQEVEQYSGSYTVTTALVAGGTSEIAQPGWLYPANAAYIAAMNPLVGKALAEWLRAEGSRLDRSPAAFGGAPLFKPQPEAMTLARLINGSAP
jgi:hypothetical protein